MLQDDDEEGEESSEYVTDSEDDTYTGRRLLKPVFVPKESREVRARGLGGHSSPARGRQVPGACVFVQRGVSAHSHIILCT